MQIIYKIINFILGYDFQVSFWSGITVSAITGFVVYKNTNIFNSPKLIFVVKQNGLYRNTIHLTKKSEKYNANFQLAIKNVGNKAIKTNEGYWHLYFNMYNSPYLVQGENGHHRDEIKGTAYPNNFLDINHTWDFDTDDLELIKNGIPYFFSTDYGPYPKKVKVNPRNGEVLFEDMAFLKFKLPEETI